MTTSSDLEVKQNGNQNTNEKKISPIGEKEWLDLAWKYFQQHSQQRISHFNFFVIFSTIITSGIITMYQKEIANSFIAIGLSSIQIFISFIFYKIDGRTNFLIKHSEDVIKGIESHYSSDSDSLLFTSQELKALKLKDIQVSKLILLRPMTHGKSYRWFYRFFCVLSILELIIAICLSSNRINKETNIPNTFNIENIQIIFDTAYSLKRK